MDGCEHLFTSGSGQHQAQHGSNTALLPSNCYHSPCVLLLRYCSADQPLRAQSVEASFQTHTRTVTQTCTHIHTCGWFLLYESEFENGWFTWFGKFTKNQPYAPSSYCQLHWTVFTSNRNVFISGSVSIMSLTCPPPCLTGQWHRYNRCWGEGGVISLQPILYVRRHTGGWATQREEQTTLI